MGLPEGKVAPTLQQWIKFPYNAVILYGIKFECFAMAEMLKNKAILICDCNLHKIISFLTQL